LSLPLEDAGTCGSGFRFGDVAGLLQGNRQCGVGERIVGGKRGERQGCSDGLFEAAGIAESADETVVCLEVIWVSGNGRAKGVDGEGSITVRELIHRSGAEFFGRCALRFVHNIL
jgi:hypothetical protein